MTIISAFVRSSHHHLSNKNSSSMVSNACRTRKRIGYSKTKNIDCINNLTTTNMECSFFRQQHHTKRRLFSSKRATNSKNNNNTKCRPKVSTFGSNNKNDGGSVDSVWYTSTNGSSLSKSLEMGRYGLKRLDYKTLKPPIWQTPPHPPTKTILERTVFPLTLVIVAGVIIWAYLTPEEEDMTDYWKRVESGRILFDDYDDDDDDDDDDEEEEEHEIRSRQ
mmetsp:Transcript_24655/g.26518  ORF Transcript_24655/g.26518 Transcript_24655/m.26518 type:complete len:220 (-) Transcript_24655:116-775(-)